MEVSLHINDLAKKFNQQWVFKSVDLCVLPYEKIAVLGMNGSGKSTLLKIMAGFLYFDKGNLNWKDKDEHIIPNLNFAYSAPYIDLFEALTVEEHFKFHFKQKPIYEHLNLKDIIEIANLGQHQNKPIKQLSSGIKQRFKNALAIFTQSDVLFLDEPCSNLDQKNTSDYQKLVAEYTKHKLVVIGSNNPDEYDFLCTKSFRIENCGVNLSNNKQQWA